MDKNDWFQVFGILATFSASFVALFKDWIQSWFYKVKFEFKIPRDGFDEEVVNNQAIRYYTNLEVFNTGNLYAEDCFIYLESACFYIDNENAEMEIRRQLVPITWDDQNKATGIAPNSHRVIEVFKLLAPVIVSSPDTDTESVPAKCIFAGTTENDAKAGKWEVTYSVNSKNGTTQRFTIVVTYNGEWKSRKSDIKSRLDVKLK